MNRLVEQLLFLARGDSGRTKLAFEPFSLRDMVREVYEESVMIHPGYKWSLFAEQDVTVTGDAAMLKQAVRILVDNAVKYTQEGQGVALRATANAESIPCVSVQDSGIGIAREDVPHVFERFFRSDPARSRQSGGTGLGLAIAKWIIDRHGGYFELVSSEGIGTRFTICLPQTAAGGIV
jgi:signal transduction histidine kinase